MLPILPEILFYDIDKDEDEQEYNEEPPAIFRIHFITKFTDTQLAKYTDRWFQGISKDMFEGFRQEMNYMIDFLIGKKKKPINQEKFYIIDDIEEDEETLLIDDEDEDDFNFGMSLLSFGPLLGKAFWILRKAVWLFKKMLKVGKFLWKTLKFLGRMWKRIYKFGKKIVKKVWRLVKRLWKRHIKPFFRMLKRKIKLFWRKTKRFFKKTVFPKAKRILRKIGRQIIRAGKRIMRRIFKKIGKTVFKLAVKGIGHAVGGALAATGVGLVVTIAIEAAFIAWDVYDMTHDTDVDEPEIDEDEYGLTPEDEQEIEDDKIPEEPMPNPPSLVPFDINAKPMTEIHQRMEKIYDKTTTTLLNSKDYPKQIIARNYAFYKMVEDWLEGQETLINKLTGASAAYINQYQDHILKLADEQNDKDPIKTIEHGTYPAVQKSGKHKHKVKSPPKRISEFDILDEDKKIKERIKKDGILLVRPITWRIRTVTFNTKDDIISTRKLYVFRLFYEWENKKKREMLKQELVRKKILQDLTEHDKTFKASASKPFKFDVTLTKHNTIQERKRAALAQKNFLLYQLLGCFGWMGDSIVQGLREMAS